MFLATALANMGSPEPHTAYIEPRNSNLTPQRSKKRTPKSSTINKFFSHAFSSRGLLSAPEAYIPVSPLHPRSETAAADKFEEALEDNFTE
jgi:hypothetical protein